MRRPLADFKKSYSIKSDNNFDAVHMKTKILERKYIKGLINLLHNRDMGIQYSTYVVYCTAPSFHLKNIPLLYKLCCSLSLTEHDKQLTLGIHVP